MQNINRKCKHCRYLCYSPPIDNGTKVTFFTDLGGAFISSAAYGTQYAGMEAVIKDFAQTQALTAVGTQLKTEQKTLSTMNKDLKSPKRQGQKVERH